MRIVNLTQHNPTPEQVSAGVFNTNTAELLRLLTFTNIPSLADIKDKAWGIAQIAVASGATHAMIGGAPYLMAPLEQALFEQGIIPLYSFSERVSQEEQQPDGSVKKVNIFRHAGWVQVA
jgi:hypothetical protein